MSARDRRANVALVVSAIAGWVVVAWMLVNLDPRGGPAPELIGATAIGIALVLTAAPLLWLVAFARQRRIAYQGDWVRALRRAGWIGGLSGGLVLLRLEGLFQPQVALFLIALAGIAELTLSARR